jgi:hypothetical protein
MNFATTLMMSHNMAGVPGAEWLTSTARPAYLNAAHEVATPSAARTEYTFPTHHNAPPSPAAAFAVPVSVDRWVSTPSFDHPSPSPMSVPLQVEDGNAAHVAGDGGAHHANARAMPVIMPYLGMDEYDNGNEDAFGTDPVRCALLSTETTLSLG